MTTYVIDFSDPLKDGFSIAPGGFNGPGGSASNTSLRLYGRGALEWGESVNEDLVRLTENFNSATPPITPVDGMLWLRTKYYWLRTAVDWYVRDPDSPAAWVFLSTIATGGVVNGGAVGTNVAPAHAIGVYWYTGGAPTDPLTSNLDAFGDPLTPTTLYRWDSAYKQIPAGWMPQAFTQNAAAPTAANFPEKSLLVWDAFQGVSGTFVAPPISIVAPTQPAQATEGTLWWDSVNNILYVWNDFTTTWQPLVTGGGGGSGDTTYLRLDGTNTPTANLNIGGFRLTNITTNVGVATDALSVGAADTRYVNITGDTMTGVLAMGAFNITGLPVMSYPDLVNTEFAATKNYVNTAVTSITSGGGSVTVPSVFVSPAVPTYKAGDIYVLGAVIYIAIGVGVGAPPGGNWRQVFPAQYS